jgi:hypothetical protein
MTIAVAFVIGVASGCAGLAVLLCWAGRAEAEQRRRQAEAEKRRAFEAWCGRVGWCPAHNVLDGECPTVEVRTEPLSVRRRAACPGSAVFAMTGPVVDAEGIEWHYTPPPVL